MRLLPLCLLIAAPLQAAAPYDAAHRADRLRTAELNRAAGAGQPRRANGSDDAARRYQDERARYYRRLADWRRRVAACEAGDYGACER